jgi:DNA polymerase I
MTDAIETNPFDNLSALRLDQSYADTVGVKKLLTTVPVRKPNRQDFVRVHPDSGYRLTPAAIIEVKEDREAYLVTPHMAQALAGEFATVTLFTTINRQGTLHLWPVKLPTPEGRHNEWHRSAAEGAERAMKKWVRVTASMSLGRRVGSFLTRCGRTFRSRKFSRSPSATALWTVLIIPWCSGFGESCSRGGASSLCTIDPADGDTASLKQGNTTGPMLKAAATLAAADGGTATDGGRTLLDLLPFAEIWAVDFEFGSELGENPEPVCLIAWELRSGRKVRLWRDEFGRAPPYPIGPTALFIAYYASAEIGCHLALGWPVPERVLDLFTEFRNRTNGVPTENGSSLLGTLAYHGLDGMGAVEKEEMRALILRGGPWSDAERAAILDYCESDVAALARLLPVMLPHIDLPRALLRGRYMVAAARMERNGAPIDTETLRRLRDHWSGIQDQLIADIDANYGVFDGRAFKTDRFTDWLVRNNIPWPRLESGRLDLSDDTFREMARAYPPVAPLRELRATLCEMRLSDLAVGRDGRNRTMLSAFRARTSRNQPSNTKFIFGPSVWLRGLIKPPPGYGIAYIDWQQQEFGIAAALSRDPLMMDAYRSGDPYLAFAKQAGAAPADATKSTHKAVRDQFKSTVLAVQYGMGADALAQRIGQPPFTPVSSCACTTKPTECSGAGPMLPWTTPC